MNSQDFGRNNQELRDSWVKYTLKKLPPGLKLLDAGAGEQHHRKDCSQFEYTSQDLGEYDGSGDKVGMQNQIWDQSKNEILSDITSIPVPDGSFDIILCTEVFEHLPEPIKAITEFSRILKSGGHLILTVPVCSLAHQCPYYFNNGFSRYFYEKFLPENNMDIVELTPSGSWLELIAQETMRIPYIAQRYCGAALTTDVNKALIVVLQTLYKLSQMDNGSSELASYGYHIHAIKR